MNLDPRILLRRTALTRDYKETFGSPHGQRVLAHILRVSGVTAPKFSLEPNQLLWNEAQRHFALSIFRQVHSSLDKLPDHIEEELSNTENNTT